MASPNYYRWYKNAFWMKDSMNRIKKLKKAPDQYYAVKCIKNSGKWIKYFAGPSRG